MLLIGWSAFQVAGMSRISRAQSKTALPGGNLPGSSKKLELTACASTGSTAHRVACSSTPSSRRPPRVAENPVEPHRKKSDACGTPANSALPPNRSATRTSTLTRAVPSALAKAT